ncbi:uncharacterized protein LOC141651197 [Silene latifolia]|uniref:uncharacterized protein LOC141651197 n=1 Tax=Silene latifolia TaxID=37657 RepID=UPI003D7832B3
MAGDSKGDMNGPKTIPVTSPLFLHPSESPNLNVTQIIFNGNNYDLWADAVKNGLDAKNKLAFIEGRVKKPSNDGDEETVESEELRGRYAAGNAPRVHQLKGELNECKQGTDSVVEYYTRLKTIWDELGNYSTAKACTCGAAASIAKEKEEEKVHQFLLGLDSKLYGNVRTNLLMEDPIANMNRVYAIVLREERHASITKVKEEKIEAAAMAARTSSAGRGRTEYKKQDADEEDSARYCSYCKKYYHTEENCYDKHEYEEVKARERGRGRRGNHRGGNSRGRGRGRGYQANAMGATSGSKSGESSNQNIPFTSEEIDKIRSLLNGSADGNDRLKGMKITLDVDWLIDSGCSHYMTGKKELLRNIRYGELSTVSLPDGRKMNAQIHGEVELSKNFILKDVLFVPTLTCDLISVQQLISENNCVVNFDANACEMQDRITRMTIGRGEHRQGVYYYKPEKTEQTGQVTVTKEGRLCHNRVGH